MTTATNTTQRQRRRAVSAGLRPLTAGVLLGCMAVSSVAWPSGRSAVSPGVTLNRLRFPEGSRHDMLADRIWLHGLPAQVLVFDSPVAVPDLIRDLSTQQPALVDLNVLPDQIILSGWVDDMQWAVQLQAAGPSRTVGTVSTLRMNSVPGLATPAWLPRGAIPRLDLAVQEKGGKVSDRIWQLALPPARLGPLLHGALRREGWVFETETESGAEQSWAQAGERLQISLTALDGGSGLHVRRWTP